LSIIMTLACVYMKMTPLEALQAVTWNSAYSLGLHETKGIIAAGKQADLVIWNVRDYRDIAYWYGMNHVKKVIKNGCFQKCA
jgi:imidazolonepropionase